MRLKYPPEIRPLDAIIGRLTLAGGKYCLMMAWVIGFKSLLGILMNLWPSPPTVFAAISWGVSATAAGTSGFAESANRLKSPVHKLGCARVVLRRLSGWAV